MRLYLPLLMLLSFASTNIAVAHDPRPLHIKISHQDPTTVNLVTKLPNSVSVDRLPLVTLAPPCVVQYQSELRPIANAYIIEARYGCDDFWPRIDISYPRGNPSLSTLVHYQNGAVDRRLLLAPDALSWQATAEHPAVFDQDQPAEDLNFLTLGIEHIIFGFDHLAFVLGLIVIAGTTRRIFWAITSFTLGHSLSLISATLGFVSIPIPFVEIMIAASILLLAHELTIGQKNTLNWRYPAGLSLAFGLIHGLGFAAVLTDLEIASDGLVWSLITFNIGVEIGQLAFIMFILGLVWFIIQLPRHPNEHQRAILISALIGTSAAYWLTERLFMLAFS